MSKKLVKATNLFKRLTGIVGVVGVSSLLGLPALSQSNTTPNQSSPTTAGEVCVIPQRTINTSGNSTDMSNMGGGTSGNTDVQGTAGSMGDATGGNQGTTGNTDTSANTQRTDSSNSSSASTMQGMIVCGTLTTPDATNLQRTQ